MYNFGQFRRNQFDSYMSNLKYQLEDFINPSPFSSEISFVDKEIILDDDNILQSTDATGNVVKSYYFQIKIYKQEEEKQEITIKLFKDATDDNEQNIETLVIPEGDEEDFCIFDFVIQPIQSYNKIQIILNRTLTDYNIINKDLTYGRKIKIEILKLNEIYNIIDFLNPKINNTGRLKQIGVQSAPGLLMSIEGEPIRVGRNGIYEINNGISIKNIGFVVEPDDNKNFILDYQY